MGGLYKVGEPYKKAKGGCLMRQLLNQMQIDVAVGSPQRTGAACQA